MTRATKIINLGAVVVPFLATLAAIVLLWNRLVSGTDLAIFAVMYLVTAAGITVGFHRMLTHRSFRDPQADASISSPASARWRSRAR